MQKIKDRAPGAWASTKTNSKKGFDTAWKWLDKLGAPINRLSNKVGSEAFWPTTLDKESDKAARILRSFCKDGFYTDVDKAKTSSTTLDEHSNGKEEANVPQEGVPRGKQRVLKKIPQKVIENAVGLAIFTTMRTGLWLSGAGGSGVLVARKADGSWSAPSGIMLHTAGLGFLVGVDIYDCVVVINDRKALGAFTKVRATLGGEISAVAGPVGVGGVLENDGKWKEANKPVFTYLKSRGFYAGVQVDGTIVIERTDENARFYDQPEISVGDILAGKNRRTPPEIKTLMETLKAAEGRTDVDETLLEELDELPAPGDVDLEAPGKIFGIPEDEDPDPYGVKALEAEGLEIHEAGTGSRPSSDAFRYNPSPTSPVFGIRSSLDNEGLRNHRQSLLSMDGRSRSRASTESHAYSDAGTQTPDTFSPPRTTKPSGGQADDKTDGEGSDRAYELKNSIDDGERHDHDPWHDAPESADGNVWSDAVPIRPRGPPPALPPRTAAQAGFVEVDLEGAKANGVH